jgi:hypothetical protein
MRLQAGSLFLSPSDVTAFLACEHLTTLQLTHARGELARPEASNDQADLIRRKGKEHERSYLELLRGRHQDVREIEFDGRDWDEAQARTLGAMRAGADIVYQGVFSEGAGVGWQTSLCGYRFLGVGRLELRGAGHEAGAFAEAGLHLAAVVLQRAAGAAARAGAGRDPCDAGVGRAGVVPAGGVRGLLPARPRPA